MHIGSFNAYATRFFSPAYGFALTWNYWFNAAISVASDLTAAQLVLGFWDVADPWIFSVIVWAFILFVNALHVKAYGELGEYNFPTFLDHAHAYDAQKTQSIGWLHLKLSQS